MKKCKKTTKPKLILSRKYLNCHQNRNSLTYHRRNTKSVFRNFSKQKWKFYTLPYPSNYEIHRQSKHNTKERKTNHTIAYCRYSGTVKCKVPTETVQVDEKIRLLDFLAKIIMPYAAKQLKITFRTALTLFKVFLRF